MKKLSAVWTAVFIFAAALDAQDITFELPKTGQRITRNCCYSIYWEGPTIPYSIDVRLSLRRFGAEIGVIDPDAEHGGDQSWTVGEYQGGLAPVGGGYQLRVQTPDMSHWGDSPVFEIIAADEIGLNSEIGGKVYAEGSKIWIPWHYSGGNCSSHMMAALELRKDGVKVGDVEGEFVFNPGMYDGGKQWQAGLLADGTWAGTGQGFKVRIKIGTATVDTGSFSIIGKLNPGAAAERIDLCRHPSCPFCIALDPRGILERIQNVRGPVVLVLVHQGRQMAVLGRAAVRNAPAEMTAALSEKDFAALQRNPAAFQVEVRNLQGGVIRTIAVQALKNQR
ncbi:MAG: hypothetical protein ACYDH0_11660 [Candidatus Aminicenantales bacterium]